MIFSHFCIYLQIRVFLCKLIQFSSLLFPFYGGRSTRRWVCSEKLLALPETTKDTPTLVSAGPWTPPSLTTGLSIVSPTPPDSPHSCSPSPLCSAPPLSLFLSYSAGYPDVPARASATRLCPNCWMALYSGVAL